MRLYPHFSAACAVLLITGWTARSATLFSEPFDSLSDGALNGQNGWTATPANAGVVQGAITYGGSARACAVTNDGTRVDARITLPLTIGSGTNVVWTEWRGRPTLATRSGFPIPTNATALFYALSGTGYVVAYNGTTATVLSGKPAVPSGAWAKFTVRADYSARTWSLWLNGTNMATDFAFYNTNIAAFATFNVQQSTTANVSYVDAMKITELDATTAPVDLALPFAETFETLELGSLAGQRGWRADVGGPALVQAENARTGTQGGQVSRTAAGVLTRVTHPFTDPSVTNVVWSDWYAQPAFNSRTYFPLATNATMAFYVQAGSGYVVAQDGTNQTVLSGKPTVTAGAWTRFTTRADYASRTWSLWVNGTNMAKFIRFANTNISRYATFGVDAGQTNAPSPLDDLAIGTNAPAGIAEPVLALSIANATPVLERNASQTTSAVFTVSLSDPIAAPVSFTYAAADGTATASSDYTAVFPTTITLPAGQTTTNLSVTVIGDSLGEADETFFVTVNNAVNAVITNSTGLGTILNDDVQPTSTVSSGAISITPSNATATISVTATGGAPTVVYLYWGASDGTNNKTAWTYNQNLGTQGVGTVTGALTNLNPQTAYYYRSYLSNAYMQVWSETRQFATGPWTLPFAEPFETLDVGNIQGQRGWTVSSNYLALVQGVVKQAGNQACMITNAGLVRLSHGFDDTTAVSVVWSDWYARPVFNGQTTLVLPANATVVFYAQTNTGYVVVMDGTNKTVLSGKPAVAPGAWTRFTTKADYGTKKWSLWMNTTSMVVDARFYNTNISRLASFNMDQGVQATPAYVDSLGISTSVPDFFTRGAVYKMR